MSTRLPDVSGAPRRASRTSRAAADFLPMNVGSMGAGSAAQVQNAQSLAVLRQVMDAQKMEGQAALKLIATAQEASPPPANAPGTGSVVDVMA